MKKFIIILASTLLFQTTATAATIQGSSKSCKIGSVKIDSKYKYVCVANGLWKKTLIPIKKPVVTPITPTNSIQETPTTAVKNDQVQVVKEPVIQAVPIQFDINNLSVDEVYKRARIDIENHINSSNYVNDIFIFHIPDGLDMNRVNTEKQTLARTGKLWSNIYKPTYKVETIFYDHTSLQWAKDLFKSITGQDGINQSQNCTPNYCGNASNNIIGNKPIVYEQGMGGGDNTLRSTSAHEYTHLAQTAGNSEYWSLAPLWLVEGMAQFYGEAVGYASFDSNKQTRKQIHMIFSYNYTKDTKINIKDKLLSNNSDTINSLMNSLEFPQTRYNQETATLAYLVGGYASEVLVAVYGHDKVEEFIMSFKNSTDWETSFSKIFGITKNDFYNKLTPYFASVATEL